MKQNSMISADDFRVQNELDQINSIWFAIMKMDPFLLNCFLDNNITYQDLSKDGFIELLNERFNDHKTLGDSELFMDLDYCNGCNCITPVCKFVGNHSGKHFALNFKIENGKIMDIYHCNWYGDIDFFDTF